MSSSSQEEIAVNLPMIRKMERICRFLSQIQKKLSQIQTFFCHRFKHFCQHRSNHALDFHFLLLSLYGWPNLANKKSGECGDFWPSRSFLVFCFLNEQWTEKLEIICRSYLLPSDQFVSFHFHFLNRKMFMYLSKNVWSVLRLHFCLLLLWTKMIKKGSAVGRPLVWRPALPQIYIFHIYTRPKFTQIPDLHRTQIYTKNKFGSGVNVENVNLGQRQYCNTSFPEWWQCAVSLCEELDITNISKAFLVLSMFPCRGKHI